MPFIKRMLTFKVRKKRRFKARGGLYVVLGNSLTQNQVVDINMRGLSFYYVDQGIKPRDGSYELTFLSNNSLLAGKVPFKTVSDVETAEIMFQNKKIKRQSVRFGRLSFSQKSKLKDILKNFT
jgi:hypothetical protein